MEEKILMEDSEDLDQKERKIKKEKMEWKKKMMKWM